jgi:hypothetical protein
METCDYILLILNCEKYKDKAENQKQTWLKLLPQHIRYYHVIGNKLKCQDKEIYIDEDNRVIYTNTKDDYNSLPSKVITALSGVLEKFDFKFIMKTDDDQKLVVPTFFDTFVNILNEKKAHYGGYSLKVPDHFSQYYLVHDCLPKNLFLKSTKYVNGRFYFLSKEAVQDVVSKKENIKKQIIEDHAIGLFLDEKYKESLLHFDTRRIFFDNT